ncbi:Methionine--tRNA ligase [Anopheles sinensis]|uniref:Methionine--tRNA ligase n=1 Tax=Anopheles sinensis TaxID=74873 RepID=A0A084WSU7_ANOSI|nr:Methionine--tRNA ligase [Anopheles sinensis]
MFICPPQSNAVASGLSKYSAPDQLRNAKNRALCATNLEPPERTSEKKQHNFAAHEQHYHRQTKQHSTNPGVVSVDGKTDAQPDRHK